MLIRLLPDKVVANWPAVEKALLPAIPIEHRNSTYLLRLQQLIGSGIYVVWTIVDDNQSPVAIFVTSTLYDDAAQERMVNAYALANIGDKKIPQKNLEEAMVQLRTYAKSLGASRILAITQNPRALDMCNSLGFRTDTTLVSFSLKEN